MSHLALEFIFWLSLIVIFVSIIYGTSVWLYKIAEKGEPADRRLVTICPLGKALFIMRGGRIRKVISNGNGIDYGDDFILKDSRGLGNAIVLDPTTGVISNPEMFKCLKDHENKSSGIHLIGIPGIDKVWSFHSEWNDVEKRDREGKQTSWFSLLPRVAEVSAFSIMKSYGFMAPSLEMGGRKVTTTSGEAPLAQMVTIDIPLNAAVIIINPYKALARINWYKRVDAAILQVCTQYCGTNTLDDLIADSGKELVSRLMKLNPDILEKYGVIFFDMTYGGYDFAGIDKEEMTKNSHKRWDAIQEADADLTKVTKAAEGAKKTAEGEAAQRKLPGEAEAEIAIKVAGGAGELAVRVIEANAYRDNKAVRTSVRGGNPSILVGTGGKDEIA